MRVLFAAVAVALAGAGVFYAMAAHGTARFASCKSVHVTGGDFNGAGGTILASVDVKNVGHRACLINARPSIRFGALRYPVTVADAAPGMFWKYGNPERTWTLRPGQHISAQVFLKPGSCDRSVSAVFGLRARAGWAGRSVVVSSDACKNGTGRIWVGSFQR